MSKQRNGRPEFLVLQEVTVNVNYARHLVPAGCLFLNFTK
jgi:hypothetical protein